jgi:undecaprenyl-diphosphatase
LRYDGVLTIMSLLQVVILALVQGLTEFLPISSSAHLALAPWLLGWPDQGLAFDIALHLGTLIAVVIYFIRDWVQVISQAVGYGRGKDPELSRNPRLLWLLVMGSIPIGVLGYLFKHQAETVLRSPFVMGTMLIAVAILMAWSERRAGHKKGLDHVSFMDAAAIGLAQALAIVPGTSRSGITMSAGLFRNLDHYAAARFSFLLSAPAVAAAAAKAFLDLQRAGGIAPDMRTPFLLGITVSAVSGGFAIGFLMKYLRTRGLRFFVYYRVIFGIIVLVLATLRHPAG